MSGTKNVKLTTTALSVRQNRMNELSKKGMEIYKKMYVKLEEMKKTDRVYQMELREKKNQETKKLEMEKNKKAEEKKRLEQMLTNTNNIITKNLENGDLIMFSGNNMKNALNSTYRYYARANTWSYVDRNVKHPPKTMAEYNKNMEELKKKVIQAKEKEMLYDFGIILAEMEKTVLDDFKKDHVYTKKIKKEEVSEKKEEVKKEEVKKEDQKNTQPRLNNSNYTFKKLHL